MSSPTVAFADCPVENMLSQPLEISLEQGKWGEIGTLRQLQEGGIVGDVVGKITLDRASFAVQTPDGETVAYIQYDLSITAYEEGCDEVVGRLNPIGEDFFVVESDHPIGSIAGRLPEAHFEVEGIASRPIVHPPAREFEDDLGKGYSYAQGTTFRVVYCEPTPLVFSTFLDHESHNSILVKPFGEVPDMASKDDYEDWHRLCQGLEGSYR